MSNENILLQTLGFDVAIDHPHTHVVKCCQLVKGEHEDEDYRLHKSMASTAKGLTLVICHSLALYMCVL